MTSQRGSDREVLSANTVSGTEIENAQLVRAEAPPLNEFLEYEKRKQREIRLIMGLVNKLQLHRPGGHVLDAGNATASSDGLACVVVTAELIPLDGPKLPRAASLREMIPILSPIVARELKRPVPKTPVIRYSLPHLAESEARDRDDSVSQSRSSRAPYDVDVGAHIETRDWPDVQDWHKMSTEDILRMLTYFVTKEVKGQIDREFAAMLKTDPKLKDPVTRRLEKLSRPEDRTIERFVAKVIWESNERLEDSKSDITNIYL